MLSYNLGLQSLQVCKVHNYQFSLFLSLVDAFALGHCESLCLVKDFDGNRIHGLFHHMNGPAHGLSVKLSYSSCEAGQ